jgi:HAD superfamily hydrolase (TIGR01509 family)
VSYATTVLFDVGETLLHVPEPAPIYREVLARQGRSMSIGEIEANLKEVRRIVDEHIPNWLGDDVSLDCNASARRRAMHVDTLLSLSGLEGHAPARAAFFDLYVGTEFFTIYSDVSETLQRLRSAGCRLGIVSNWESRLPELCTAHGIAEYFDFTVVSEVEGFVKPHPHIYRRALELAGAPAERVVHVGDSLRDDIQGAAAVGIRGILVDRTGASPVGYEPRISSLADLDRVLDAAG